MWKTGGKDDEEVNCGAFGAGESKTGAGFDCRVQQNRWWQNWGCNRLYSVLLTAGKAPRQAGGWLQPIEPLLAVGAFPFVATPKKQTQPSQLQHNEPVPDPII